ncbi:RHS repeat domain-containing protein, partial [Roseburia inulinivorans]|uniref:RHS repeat domain-containing protein n=1 Tax=Roseburia inulinivorans TaxID=360807 RepID=UPI00155DCEE9
MEWKVAVIHLGYDKKKCYHYDGQGLLTAAEDRNGQCVRLYYEGERLTRITTPLGYFLDVEIRDGRLVQIRDHVGRTMQYRYE